MGFKRFLKIHKASLSFLLILIIFSASFLVMIKSYNLGGVAVGMLDSSESETTQTSTDGGEIPLMEEAEAIDYEDTIEDEKEEEIIDLIVRPLPDRTLTKTSAGDNIIIVEEEYASVLGGMDCGDGVCDENENSINCILDCKGDMGLYPSERESLLNKLIKFFNKIFKPFGLATISSINGTNQTNETHKICYGDNCITVQGIGVDECQYNYQCTTNGTNGTNQTQLNNQSDIS